MKANAGTIQGITRSGDATDGYTTTIEGKLSVSSNGAFSISGDKYTVDSDGSISAAGGKFSVNSSGVLTIGSETQNTSVSDAGLTITDGPSVTTSGIDAGGKKITNLGQGVADNDAVNVQQLRSYVTTAVQTGGSFGAGQGLVVNKVTNGSLLEVKAGEGLGFASDGSLKVNEGDGLTIDTENGNALKVDKSVLTGKIETKNAGFVTGGDVYSALSAYAKSDGATLENAMISSGSIANDVRLGGADSTITVGSLKTSVSDNTDAISTLKTTVGNAESGLVKDVADSKDAITTKGITFTADNVGVTSGAIKLGDTLAVNGDSNITTEASAGKVAIKLKNSIDLGNEGSMTIGNAKLNTSGLAIGTTVSLGASGLTVGNTSVSDTGLAISGGPSVTSDGIAAGGKQITGVAEGVNDTDAVNKAQLDTELAKVNAGAVYSGGDGVAISAEKISVKKGKGLAFDTDGTLTVDNGGGLIFDDDKKLTINTGADLTIDGTGKLQVNKSGKVEESNTGLVTGGTVFNALSGYAKIDGATLTNVTLTGATFKSGSIANDVTIGSSGVTIGTLKSSVDTNTSDISALKATLNDANTGLIKTVNDNANAIQKNATDITSLNSKITANETALSKKADKANTLKGYGIEDAYTKEDTDTLLNKKADKTELEKVKATANSNKKALDALGDVQELAKDAEAVKKIANDVETVVKEQDGAVAAEGQKDADELVKGSTVYDYLNKGKDGNGKLVLGTESKNITMGQGSETTGDETVTMGFNNQVNGNQNVTIGTKHMVKGDSNTVIGDPDNITGNKNVVLANDTNITLVTILPLTVMTLS